MTSNAPGDRPTAMEVDSPSSPRKRRKLSPSLPSEFGGSSVLSGLFAVRESLRTTFGVSQEGPADIRRVVQMAKLNPLAGPPDSHVDIATRRRDIRARLESVRTALEAFRAQWKAEKDAVAVLDNNAAAVPNGNEAIHDVGTSRSRLLEDPDAALERKKAALLRIMVDWCNNQASLLPLHSALQHLERESTRNHRLAASSETPFVHPLTSKSPTQRLIALAQSLGLDCIVDDENPDYGMGTAGDGHSRVDSLAFAAKTVLIDMQIQQPGRDGLYSLIGLKVTHHPTEESEGITLEGVSSILKKHIETYLGVLNERVEDCGTGPSKEIQAERAFQGYARSLQELVDLDGPSNSENHKSSNDEPEMDPRRFEELEAFRTKIQNLADRGQISFSSSPSILPSFRLRAPAGLRGTDCALRLQRPATSPDAVLASHHMLSPSGWCLDLSPAVIVERGLLMKPPSTDISWSTESSLDKLWLHTSIPQGYSDNDPVKRSSLEDSSRIDIEPEQTSMRRMDNYHFKIVRSGLDGLTVARIATQSAEALESSVEVLIKQLCLRHMYSSAVRCSEAEAIDPSAAGSEDVDDELQRFMKGEQSSGPRFEISLAGDHLCVRIPRFVIYDANHPSRAFFSVKICPGGNSKQWLVRVQDPTSDSPTGMGVPDIFIDNVPDFGTFEYVLDRTISTLKRSLPDAEESKMVLE